MLIAMTEQDGKWVVTLNNGYAEAKKEFCTEEEAKVSFTEMCEIYNDSLISQE